MFFMKLAVVTCAIYMAFHCLIYATFTLLPRKDIISGFHFSRVGPFIFFGLIWLASFSVAWRIVVAPLLSTVHQ